MQQTPQERFGASLGLVARLWRAEIDRRLSRFGLTESRWLTLLRLSRLEAPVTQQELADAVGVRGATLVRTLDWLEGEGLIERRSMAADRRTKSVHLQRRAAPVLARIDATTAAVRTEIFSGIPKEDIATCLRVFEKLTLRLQGVPRAKRFASETRLEA
jgi:MarR family transcriptional regulator for hemolysin